MNWENIQKEYPEAYELFIKSDQYKTHDIYGFIETRIRDLFDFFDENGTIVEVSTSKYLDENKLDLILFDYVVYHDKRNEYECESEFETRSEAEKAAFTKAFKILNDKLK